MMEAMKGSKRNWGAAVFSLLFPAALSFWMVGCAALDQRSVKELEAAYGPNAPRIEASFAADEVVPGDVWRLYIKGSDKDGDIRFINVWMMIPSRTTTPIRLEVAEGQGGHVSGYLTLNTLELGGGVGDLFRARFRFLVSLEDRAGHRSEYVQHYLEFIFGARPGQPPQGAFEERFLGRIPPEFDPVEPSPGLTQNWP